MFKEGTVQRTNGQFGGWSYVCDEIIKLRQRFCSLSSTAVKDGQQIKLTLSTSDTGIPAAALDLPTGVYLQDKITLTLDGAKKPAKTKKGKGAASDVKSLRMLTCDESACHTVFPVEQGDIAALRAGGRILVKFRQLSTGGGAGGAVQVLADREIEIAGLGFEEALNATITPGGQTETQPTGQ